MAPSWFKLILVAGLIFVLFGRGKLSELMGDFAKGIKSFKQSFSEDPDEPVAKAIPDEPAAKAIEDRPAALIEARAPLREDLRA